MAAATILCLAASMSQAQALAQFDLPPQSLAASLRAVGSRTSTNVLFDPPLVEGMTAPGVAGEFTAEEAFRRLLAGTGLRYRFLDDKTVMVISATHTPTAGITDASTSSMGVIWLAQAKTSQEAASPPLDGAAAETGSTVSGQGQDAQKLEEVVVTSTKRAENLQDVPISISAVSARTMELAGISRMEDLDRLVPNIELGKGSQTFGSLTIRGVSGFSRNAGVDDRASVYLDGAYLGQSQVINQAFYDLERVEVLRGPQGTLFGKNTISGAVNMITRPPSDEFSGHLSMDYGNYSDTRVAGTVNAPLVAGRLAVKASAMKMQRDGYVLNETTGNWLENEDSTAGRLQVRFTPSDSTEFNLSLDALRSLRDSDVAMLASNRPYTAIHEKDGTDDMKTRGIMLNSAFRLRNGGSITSISSLRHADTFGTAEEDYTAQFMAVTHWGEDNTHFTQELRYASAKHERYDYVAGVYYEHENREARHDLIIGPDFFFPTGNALTVGESKVDTYAAFAHGNYRLTDSITLTGGVRYTQEHKSVVYNMNDGSGLFIDVDNFRDSKSTGNWTPKIGVNALLAPEVMAYASYSRGYKSGGWFLDHISTLEHLEFDPEFVDAYEVGLKSDLLNGVLRVNGAAFLSKYSDYQVNQFVFTQGGTTIITLTNAGKVTSRGVELELAARPTANLSISAAVGYLDAYYASFKDGGGIGIDYDGNELTAPDWTGSLSAGYTHKLRSGSLQTFADWSVRSRTHGDPSNDPRMQVPGYGLANARVGYVSEDGKWAFSLWGQNLTDRQYLTFRSVSFFGSDRLKYGIPRTYGISLRVDF